jgi:hypothetical protein
LGCFCARKGHPEPERFLGGFSIFATFWHVDFGTCANLCCPFITHVIIGGHLGQIGWGPEGTRSVPGGGCSEGGFWEEIIPFGSRSGQDGRPKAIATLGAIKDKPGLFSEHGTLAPRREVCSSKA